MLTTSHVGLAFTHIIPVFSLTYKRESEICLGINPVLANIAMFFTQDIALNFYFKQIFVLGHKFLPLKGPVILAPTHRSRWDGLLLVHAAGRRLSKRDCRFMVTTTEMQSIQGWFLNRLGCFPIDKSKPSLISMRYALDLINAKEQLVIFPEGKINQTRELKKLQKGIVKLSKISSSRGADVNIVPIGIAYTHKAPKAFEYASICFEEPIQVSNDNLISTNELNQILFERIRFAESKALRAIGSPLL